jgi:hypothetical protein
MRFVWVLMIERDNGTGEHSRAWWRYLIAGLVAVGIVAVIVARRVLS